MESMATRENSSGFWTIYFDRWVCIYAATYIRCVIARTESTLSMCVLETDNSGTWSISHALLLKFVLSLRRIESIIQCKARQVIGISR